MKNDKISIYYKNTLRCLLCMVIVNATLMMQAQAFDKSQAFPVTPNPSLKKMPPPGAATQPAKKILPKSGAVTKPAKNTFTKPAPAPTPATRKSSSSFGKSSLNKTSPRPATKQFAAPKGTTYTAVTRKPATRQGLVKVSGANWSCRGNQCTVRSTWSRPTANECKSLARAVGIIQRFGTKRRLLNSNELKSCNQGIAVNKDRRIGFINSKNKQTTRTFGKKPVKDPNRISTPAPLSLAPQKNTKSGGFTRKGKIGVNPATQKSAQSLTRAQTQTKPQGSRTTAVKPMASGSLATGSTTGNRVASTNAGRGLARQSQVLTSTQLQNIRLNTTKFQSLKAQMRAEAEAARRRLAERRRNGTGGTDCDDNDASVHPNLPEVCDHKDNNCNGTVDEGQLIIAYADLDGDGHGNRASRLDVCASDFREAQERGDWLSNIGNDCDDNDPDNWRNCP